MRKKTAKTKKGTVRKRAKAKKAKKVEFSGKRHLEGLVKAAKGHPKWVFDVLSAVRGPDSRDVKYFAFKERYTEKIRTWIFGTNGCGGMMQSSSAPVTTKGWKELYEQVMAEPGAPGNHFLGHIQGACYAIRGLYASGDFKAGT